MMKNVKKQDGYILVYVLVVILVIGIVAVSALTAAGRNHSSQAKAVKYTQDKYEAEGAIELFVAELQAASVNYVEGLKGNPVVPTDFSKKINKIMNAENTEATLEDEYEGVLQILGKTYENSKYQFVLTDLNAEQSENTEFTDSEIKIITPEKFIALFENNDDGDTTAIIEGNAYFYMNATATFGGVRVSADMKLSFAVDKYQAEDGKELAKVHGVAFEYTSYEVTTAQAEEVGGGL